MCVYVCVCVCVCVWGGGGLQQVTPPLDQNYLDQNIMRITCLLTPSTNTNIDGAGSSSQPGPRPHHICLLACLAATPYVLGS
jgi:hypothetical protein